MKYLNLIIKAVYFRQQKLIIERGTLPKKSKKLERVILTTVVHYKIPEETCPLFDLFVITISEMLDSKENVIQLIAFLTNINVQISIMLSYK